MTSPQPEGLRVLMTAGEVSGDRQAARLASEMLRVAPSLTLYGTGGEMMRAAGVHITAQTAQYGSVGIQESLRFVTPLRRVLRHIKELVSSDPPDLAVLVDNEGFNGMVARYLFRTGIPFVYYFPPQVWLWGEWRARRISRQARLIIPAFRPEADIYTREGGRVEWHGHPLLDIVRVRRDPAEVFRSLGLSTSHRTVGIMPGSRSQEIDELCEPILGAVHIFLRRFPSLQFIMPVAASHLKDGIERQIMRAGLSHRITMISEDVYECLSMCDLLVLSSGTATLEGSLLGIPMVAAYRVSPVTFAIGKRVVKSRYIAMPNILLDEPVIPEVIQERVTADRLASLGLKILCDPEASERMRGQLGRIRGILGSEGVIGRVAASILQEASLSRLLRLAPPETVS